MDEKVHEADDGLLYSIDHSWSDDLGVGIHGWIFSKNAAFDEVEICVNGTCVPITAWHPRPDVVAAFPECEHTTNCGFFVYVPRLAEHHATLRIKTEGTTLNKSIAFCGSSPLTPDDFPRADDLFVDFTRQVNENHLTVLEVGSRIVVPGGISQRPLFHSAQSYTGFDYYPDANTDVVGDAHRLSHYFGERRFGAIFSRSVFEHLAMPWVVAMEINKLLDVGGITFHSTHFAWPIHERPWDFWRFTEQALRVLFSPALGFEVVKAGFYTPLRMHLDKVTADQQLFANEVAFGNVAILACKVAEAADGRFKWDVNIEDVLGVDSHYPEK